MQNKKKLGIISLGCDKNRVDSEKLLALAQSEYEITADIEKAQIIVVNTCAFLESARKEAIETALECSEYKSSGALEKLILTGCLPQRFIDELFDEFTEVDGFLGTYDYELFTQTINECYKGKRVNNVGKGSKKVGGICRMITTPLHYAYLKIADGCNNRCTYCLIPSIRGAYFSEPIEKLVEEAQNLGDVSELILVAQDVTRYGIDLYEEKCLVKLIRELSKLENVSSIRLLYCYPDMIDDELINELKNNDKLIKYLDIPLQHASSSVLKRMNRRGTNESYLNLVLKLKQEIPSIALRSTFIAGFPGETQEDFETLKDFILKAKLTNAGFFAYSKEEGTPAYKLPNQIENKLKNSRVKELYSLQKQISKEFLASFKGKTLEIVCDGIDYDKGCFVGRAYFQAPDIDGKIYFTSTDDIVVNQGEVYTVKITKATNYDLYGRVV
ncbi:MAG: 30S ribosomal protein S12 methylthiotransferase RimO [Clostridia bacterium]|nr:30S ribosomal protein S12 methylthiotransferase RimO [Clostridia bacterium]